MATDRSAALSEHYVLGDFLVDETFPDMAKALAPSEEVQANLRRLAGILEQVEAHFPGGWAVRSGFRDQALNEACRELGLPASADSLHLLGCAADVAPRGEQDVEAVFHWLSEHGHGGLDLQEAVVYPNKGFIHLAVPHPSYDRPRRFIMRV